MNTVYQKTENKLFFCLIKKGVPKRQCFKLKQKHTPDAKASSPLKRGYFSDRALSGMVKSPLLRGGWGVFFLHKWFYSLKLAVLP
jgi:hypothetical protein